VKGVGFRCSSSSRPGGSVNAHCSWYHRSEQHWHQAGIPGSLALRRRGGRRWEWREKNVPASSRTATMGGGRIGWCSSKVHSAVASKPATDRSRAAQRRRLTGTTSIKHDALLVPVGADWPRRPFPARIIAAVGVESQGGFICRPYSTHQPSEPCLWGFREAAEPLLVRSRSMLTRPRASEH
jgi:hypothetical protein